MTSAIGVGSAAPDTSLTEKRAQTLRQATKRERRVIAKYGMRPTPARERLGMCGERQGANAYFYFLASVFAAGGGAAGDFAAAVGAGAAFGSGFGGASTIRSTKCVDVSG